MTADRGAFDIVHIRSEAGPTFLCGEQGGPGWRFVSFSEVEPGDQRITCAPCAAEFYKRRETFVGRAVEAKVVSPPPEPCQHIETLRRAFPLLDEHGQPRRWPGWDECPWCEAADLRAEREKQRHEVDHLRSQLTAADMDLKAVRDDLTLATAARTEAERKADALRLELHHREGAMNHADRMIDVLLERLVEGR